MQRVAHCATAAMLLIAQIAGSDETDETPPYISAAIDDPNRPDADRQRDFGRKPAAVIAFAGLKPGDKVADFLPGTGYFAKIFCRVVGESGHVYAISVSRPGEDEPVAEPLGGRCTNVSATILKSRHYPAPELHSDSDDPGWVYEYYASRLPVESFVAPEPLDVIWMSESYHDLHNKGLDNKGTDRPNMLWVDTALLTALKTGGILIIEDYAAQPGSRARDTERLHRIDVEQVKQEALAAGFEFIAASKVLYQANDPHTAKAHELLDKADRFLLKFRRP
jgi:predicted methyltransferase